MDLIGKIIQVLPERGGTSARTGSAWSVGTYVIETTTDRYPRKMVFEVFGTEKIQQFNIQVGDMLKVSFDIDAHEYQGRWYNSIRAWNVDRNISAMDPVAPAPGAFPPPVMPAGPAPSSTPEAAPFASNEGEDLPF